jgi:hypothetical protein
VALRHFEHDERQRERDRKPGQHLPPRHRAAIFTDDESKRDDGENAQ